MATTVADADVAVHMDANPFVRELQTKLRPIMKRIGKDTLLKVGVDDTGMEESIRSAVEKASRRASGKIRPIKLPEGAEVNIRTRVSEDTDRNVGGFFNRVRGWFQTATDSAGDFFSKIGKGAGTAFSALQSVAGPAITAVSALIAVKLIGVMITAIGVAAGVGAALAAALAIAGGAFLIFGAAAIPIMSKVLTAVKGGDKEIRKLPQSLQGVAYGVQNTKKAFDAWLEPLYPSVGRVAGAFEHFFVGLLPKGTPIVKAMATELENLGNRATKALDGKTANSFFTMLEQRGPRIFGNLANSVANFGAGLTNILVTTGPYAESLAQKIEHISESFRKWTESVGGKQAIQRFFEWVKQNGPGLVSGLQTAGSALLDLGKKLAEKDTKKKLEDFASAIETIAGAIDFLNSSVSNLNTNLQILKDFFTGKTEKDLFKMTGTKDWLKDPFKGIRNPFGGQFGGGGDQGTDWSGLTSGAEKTFDIVTRKAASAWRSIKSGVVGVADRVAEGLAPMAPKLGGIAQKASDGVKSLLGYGASQWRGIVESGGNLAGQALAPMAPRMGQIAWDASGRVSAGLWAGSGWASNAASAMSNSVQDRASGMANGAFGWGFRVGGDVASGIRASIPRARAAAADLASAVAWNFPGSPVKEGPLTVLNRGYAGRQITRMLAGGVDAGSAELGQALTRSLRVPAAAVSVRQQPVQRSSSTTNTTYNTPTFNVTAPSADPLAVVNSTFRHARSRGWF